MKPPRIKTSPSGPRPKIEDKPTTHKTQALPLLVSILIPFFALCLGWIFHAMM